MFFPQLSPELEATAAEPLGNFEKRIFYLFATLLLLQCLYGVQKFYLFATKHYGHLRQKKTDLMKDGMTSWGRGCLFCESQFAFSISFHIPPNLATANLSPGSSTGSDSSTWLVSTAARRAAGERGWRWWRTSQTFTPSTAPDRWPRRESTSAGKNLTTNNRHDLQPRSEVVSANIITDADSIFSLSPRFKALRLVLPSYWQAIKFHFNTSTPTEHSNLPKSKVRVPFCLKYVKVFTMKQQWRILLFHELKIQ